MLEQTTWAEGYYNAVTNPPTEHKQLRLEVSFVVIMHFEKKNGMHKNEKFDAYNEGFWSGLLDNSNIHQKDKLIRLYNELAEEYYHLAFRSWILENPANQSHDNLHKIRWS